MILSFIGGLVLGYFLGILTFWIWLVTNFSSR